MANDICSVNSCDRIAVSRGWCNTHYKRWYNHGDPEAVVNPRRPIGLGLKDAFEFIPPVVDENGCHIWQRGCTKDGYAAFYFGETMVYAHITAFKLHNGDIPEGLEIDHICRVRNCVNPAHLRVANRKEQSENTSVRRDSRTGVRGVRVTKAGTFQVRVRHEGVCVFSQTFKTLAEAEAAAIEVRNRYFTHNAFDRDDYDLAG